jgi:UDP-N-acetylmuramate dehydrogenase
VRVEKFPDLSVEGTAGSFFKNPILSQSEARVLQERYPDMPLFAMPETSGVKIPLAWLLDRVLHLKGYRTGSARLFERQPLVIVADRGGSARDCIALQSFVREKVREQFAIELQPEVRIIA